MLDVDHFKKLNDTYGHAAGDSILHGVADLWKAMLRQQDLIGRIGGEEFCIVLVESGMEDSLQVAQRICEATAKQAFFATDGSKIYVTVSIGLTMVDPVHQDLKEAIACADDAMYVAKKSGRNQVRAFEPSSADARSSNF